MTYLIEEQYCQLLENISDQLDIPPSKYIDAVNRYESVGKWLTDGEYENSDGQPSIYPQGSFRLGTVVRPLKNNKESDYDIDLVCELPIQIKSTTPKKIKTMVGERLAQNGTYKKMLDDEGKRCWTLQYSEEDGIGFHMDILPSVPDDPSHKIKLENLHIANHISSNAISITNKEKVNSYNWKSSNPQGYALWFDEKKVRAFQNIVKIQKQILLEKHANIFLDVEDIPDQLVKTPLQRAIQILKRHRDMRFANHGWENDKPISMIITTLSAKLYQHEEDIFSTLENIVEKLAHYSKLLSSRNDQMPTQLITRDNTGKWYIPNPVNPDENFADRWHENDSKKAKAFFKWVTWVKEDLVDILNLADGKKIEKSLKEQFGVTLIDKASSNILLGSSPAILTDIREDRPHVEIVDPSPPWKSYE